MTVRPLRALLALALAASLAGCVSLLPKAVPAELYRFGADDAPTTARAPVPSDVRHVVLTPISMPREAQGDGILTVEGQGTAYISGARWAAPAAVLFREALGRAFERAAPGVDLMGRGETGHAAAVLSLEVERFEARYDGPKTPPTIRVAIRARLLGPDGVAVASQRFDVSKPAFDNRIQPIVAAYDQAVTEALNGLVRWVDATAPRTDRR